MSYTLQPAQGDSFVNREDLLDEILSDLEDRNSTIGYALYGVRRIGKTSVFRETERRLKHRKDIVVIYFSVWDLIEESLSEFCRKLSFSIIESYAPHLGLKYRIRDLLRAPADLLKKILDKAEFKVVYDNLEFLLSLKEAHGNDNMLIESTFDLPEKLAKQTNTKCVLLVDEFPSITGLKFNGAKIGYSIIKKIRTSVEGWQHCTLCISGSIRSTMVSTAISSASPFYRQLVVKEVKPLSRKYVGELLSRHVDISAEAIDEIYCFSGGIPFYVQFLGKTLQYYNEKQDLDLIKKIEGDFLREEGDLLFREEFNYLSSKEKQIIIAIA